LVVAALLVVVLAVTSQTDAVGEYRVAIPAGTGGRIAAGETVELIPADLRLARGTVFVIDNDDVRTHEVGPFSVRAGEVLTYRFDQPGVYQGTCTVHPAGTVTITVR
jgi:plastocyanin